MKNKSKQPPVDSLFSQPSLSGNKKKKIQKDFDIYHFGSNYPFVCFFFPMCFTCCQDCNLAQKNFSLPRTQSSYRCLRSIF